MSESKPVEAWHCRQCDGYARSLGEACIHPGHDNEPCIVVHGRPLAVEQAREAVVEAAREQERAYQECYEHPGDNAAWNRYARAQVAVRDTVRALDAAQKGGGG